MHIKSAEFVISNTLVSKCPAANLPEYAFIGRSNVGKSSLINMLVGNKKLAKTSQTPGKTQLINHFLINKEWYIVDLPGYGFAKTSKVNREKWEKMIKAYLTKRTNLMTVFVLIDSRIPPQTLDLEFIDWVGSQNVPITLAFTKIDKLSRAEMMRNVETFKAALKETWAELPIMFITSAEKQIGKDDVLDFVEETNKDFVVM